MTTLVDTAMASVSAMRRIRQGNRRAAMSRWDRAYDLYLALLLGLYAFAFLLGTAGLALPDTAAAAAAAESAGAVLAVVAAIVWSAQAVDGVTGGPVALVSEDVGLLTWPVPRQELVRRALRLALLRAAGVAAAFGIVVLVLQAAVLDLPVPSSVVASVVGIPLVVVIGTLLAWLVQSYSGNGKAVRIGVAAVTSLAAAMLVQVGRRAADGDPVAAWSVIRTFASHGPLAPLAALLQPGGSALFACLGLVLLVSLAAALAVAGWRATATTSAEALRHGSARRRAQRASLYVLDSSAFYLTRTDAARIARKRRWAPKSRGAIRARLAKAVVQEQGAGWFPRAPLAAAATLLTAGAFRSMRPTADRGAAWVLAAVAGLSLAALATRWADPIRLDVDRAHLVGVLPYRRRALVRSDLLAPLGAWCCVAVLAALGQAAVAGTTDGMATTVITGCLLSTVVVGAGAITATRRPLVPYASIELQWPIQAWGVSFCLTAIMLPIAAMTFVASDSSGGGQPRTAAALVILGAVGVAACVGAIFSGARALRDNR